MLAKLQEVVIYTQISSLSEHVCRSQARKNSPGKQTHNRRLFFLVQFDFCHFNICSSFPDQDIAITSLNIGRLYGNINLWKFEPVHRIVSETDGSLKKRLTILYFFFFTQQFCSFYWPIFPKILLEKTSKL